MELVGLFILVVAAVVMFTASGHRNPEPIENLESITDEELLSELRRVGALLEQSRNNGDELPRGFSAKAFMELPGYQNRLTGERWDRLKKRYRPSVTNAPCEVNAKDPLFEMPSQYFEGGILKSVHPITVGTYRGSLIFMYDFARVLDDEEMYEKIRVELAIPGLGERRSGYIAASPGPGPVMLFRNLSKDPEGYHEIVQRALAWWG